jgi:hypothetical protein
VRYILSLASSAMRSRLQLSQVALRRGREVVEIYKDAGISGAKGWAIARRSARTGRTTLANRSHGDRPAMIGYITFQKPYA